MSEPRDKENEQLRIHLDTYAEVIGRKQQENAELRIQLRDESYLADELESSLKPLRARVEELEGALRYIAEFDHNVQLRAWTLEKGFHATDRTQPTAASMGFVVGALKGKASSVLSPKQEGDA